MREVAGGGCCLQPARRCTDLGFGTLGFCVFMWVEHIFVPSQAGPAPFKFVPGRVLYRAKKSGLKPAYGPRLMENYSERNIQLTW